MENVVFNTINIFSGSIGPAAGTSLSPVNCTPCFFNDARTLSATGFKYVSFEMTKAVSL